MWAQEIAAIDGDVVHTEVENVHGDDNGKRNASVTSEACDVIREFAVSLADGHIDAAERANLLREIRQLRAALDEAEKGLLRGGDGT